MTLAQDDHVVEAVAPNRADQAFGERILPRTSSSREDFLDPHTLHALSEGVTVDGVSIAGGRKGQSRPGRPPRSAERSTPRWDAR